MPVIQTKYSKTKQYDIPLYVNPRSTEELFSVKSIDETGIFELNQKRYSKSFTLSDINFAGVTDAEQKGIIINLSRVINSIPCRYSITVANEYVDEKAFNNRIMYKLEGDEKDDLRNAFNEIINASVTDAKQGLYQTIYLTLTITCESLREARSTFSSLEAALRSAFIQIGINGMAGSQITAMDINQRMQTWYNFTHAGIPSSYKFDYHKNINQMMDWLNIVSPESLETFNDYFVINGCRWGRVMYISEYPKSLESDIISELTKINCTNYIAINSEPLDITGLKQEISRKHASVGMKIENEKQRNRNNNDYLSDASDKLLTEKESLNNFARQVSEGDDHYFNTTIMLMFLSDSEENMHKVTDKIKTIAGVKSFEIEACFNMQREGINSTFMFGLQEFKRVCNLSAPCLAMFMPFKTQELNDDNGTYYGINQLSQNAILANRKNLPGSYHGMILGKTRSGKSVFAKCEIISNALNHSEDQIIIIDPQNEYKAIAYTKGIDGTVISFDSKKEVYVNPLDVDFVGVDYSTLQEIIAEKNDFILTLLSSCMRKEIDADEQGILDEVIEQVYSENYAMRKKLNGEGADITEYSVPEYMKTKESVLPFTSKYSPEEQVRMYSPTLQDVYQKLLDRENPVAQKLAAHMQIFVNGSLNLFNHRTNVDINKKFLVFDLSGLKANLRVTSMLVMLEIVRNKIKTNFLVDGTWTDIYIDEFHELLGISAVAEYVIKLWKEVAKMKGMMTGITQNMTDLINNSPDSDKLAAIISNTEYFALLNQSTIDRNKIAEFLPSISPALFNYVEGAARGTGLLKMGNITVPFDIRMSEESKIYKIVNTDGNNQDTGM